MVIILFVTYGGPPKRAAVFILLFRSVCLAVCLSVCLSQVPVFSLTLFPNTLQSVFFLDCTVPQLINSSINYGYFAWVSLHLTSDTVVLVTCNQVSQNGYRFWRYALFWVTCCYSSDKDMTLAVIFNLFSSTNAGGFALHL